MCSCISAGRIVIIEECRVIQVFTDEGGVILFRSAIVSFEVVKGEFLDVD